MPYCPACSASVPEGALACPTCGSTLVTTPSASDEAAPGQAGTLDAEALHAELARTLTPRYELLKLLGSGGMGAVFLAREPALRRLVAVKVLAPYLAADPRARARFEREARAAAALSHPNVVRVYAVGETATGALPYIIMQYVEGATLGQWITARKRVAERDARRILGEVATALAAAHTRELVHRDIKPSNVLIEAESGRAFVVDFGVSAAMAPADRTTTLTVTGTVVGTPAYMSPEQAAGEPVTPKSDVYSLGLLAYELLTGALPYSATTAMGWAAAHLRDPATPIGMRRPDLSPEIARLIDRCLSKRAEDRPEAEHIGRAMMPSLESEVQWPPPGLSWLHGRGRVLARLSLFAAAGGLLTMFALAFTPHILQVHAYWLARFSAAPQAASRLVEFRGDPATTSQFVWQTLLLVGLAAFTASLVAWLGTGAGLLRLLLSRRARGWHWTTLLDVAVDYDGRSGLLLAGAREFASLDAASRGRVLAARRLQTGAEVCAGLWVLAVALVWMTSLAMGGLANSENASPMTGPVWFVAGVPVLACLIASAAGRHLERRLTRAIVWKPHFDESDVDIAAWYASTPGAATPAAARRPPRRFAVLMAELLVGLLAGALLWSLAAAALAALVAAATTTRLGPEALQLTAAIAVVEREDPIGTARQLVAPLLPAPDSATDSATTTRLLRLLGSVPAATALEDYDPAPAALRAALQGPRSDRTRLPPPPRTRGERTRELRLPTALSTSEAVRRAAAHRIPADTVRLLQRVGRHPRTALLRALTHADHWDLMEPGTPLNRLGEAALANLLGAIGDVAAGDRAAARVRLGENAAAGLRLLAAPTLEANVLGRSILEAFALLPLAELEQVDGNAHQAAELREGAQRLFRLALLGTSGLGGLAADPANLEPVLDYLRDTRLPAGWRATLLSDVVRGGCTNPREILLGPSAARRRVLVEAARDARDVPHADVLETRASRDWSRYLGGPASEPWKGPLGYAYRVTACLAP